MVHEAHDIATRGEWVLIVQPTIELIKQAALDLRALGGGYTFDEVYGEASEGYVRSTIMANLYGRPRGGRIMVIPWSAFEGLAFFPGRQRWHVFVDEIPQAAD